MEKGLYYLTVPYRGTEEQKTYRRKLSLKAVAEFLNQGILVFAPVIYVNHIYEIMGEPTLENRRDVVTARIFEILGAAKGLILLTADGWKESVGVQQALHYCKEHGIPVFTISPDQLKGDLSWVLSDSYASTDVDQLICLDQEALNRSHG